MKTPQTDDLARGNHVVPTEWAEQLERERDEAREALEHVKEYGTEEINAAIELRQKIAQTLIERDEAREAAAMWESSSDAMERAGAEQARRADENREWALKAERERDEARGQNAKLRDIAERAVERIEQENWGITEVADFWKQLRAELDRLKEGRG